MRMRCRVFGHKLPETGWFGDGLYGEVREDGIDNGGGRTHFSVWHECPRCGEKWRAARFHGTDPKITAANRAARQGTQS